MEILGGNILLKFLFFYRHLFAPGDWLQLVAHPVQVEEAGLPQPLPGGGAGLHQLAPLMAFINWLL